MRKALALSLVLAAGCGESSEGALPITGSGGGGVSGGGGNPGPTPTPLPDDVRTTQATLTVPVDEDGLQTIDLSYITIGRPSATRALVLHFGGPGSSAVDTLPVFLSFLPPATLQTLFDNFLLVGLDEIGVGGSEAFNCDGVEFDVDSFTEGALTSAAAQFVTACQADYDFIELLGTPRYARDLERLRVALGFETFDFLGYSYGTQVALTYAALFPDSSGALVLDSPVDPRDSFPDRSVGQSLGLSRALQAFFDFCDRAGTGCDFGGGDAEGAFDRLYSRFNGSGQVDNQINIEATVAQFTIVEELWPALGEQLTAFESLSTIPGVAAEVGAGAFFGTTCADLPIASIDEIRTANTQIMMGEEVFERTLYATLFPCLTWGTSSEAIAWDTVLPTLDNVLVVGADGDSRTPVEFADSLSAALTGEVRVRGTQFSHAIGLQTLNTCLDDAILEFLTDGTVSTTDCP
ncbi:MAG: alpha/beta fold hydrolase [Myxococcota bacterium]